jgi:hypothetical protein
MKKALLENHIDTIGNVIAIRTYSTLRSLIAG